VETGRLPYDREKGESVPTPQGGSWELGFVAPPQTGRVKPKRVTITARVALPSHTMRITRRGMAGPSGEWNRKVGMIELSFDCTAGDYNENGRIRVTLDVESQDPTSAVPWQISDIAARIEGEISGSAPAIVFDAPATTDDSQEPADEEKAQ
jgi:hypothetical protein